MNQRDFLTLLWPSSGWYVIAVPHGSGFRHFTTQSLDDALRAIETEHKARRDVYFALASYAEKRVPSPSSMSGYGVRLQTNVQAVKALWFDIDVGKEDCYPTKRAAVEALQAFISKTALPSPMVVDSGGGLHVYWPLESELAFAEWRPLAEKLKQVAMACGLTIDVQCTSDAARVLRVPGTHNFKRDVARPVEVKRAAGPFDAAAIGAALDTVVAALGIATRALAVPSAFDALGSNVEKTFDPLHFPTVVKNCPQMEAVFRARGNVSEPVWYAALSIARLCRNPEKAIAAVSDGHPQYSADATEKKVAQLEARGIGPATCKKWSELVSNGCDSCRWKDKISSPAVSGRKVLEAAPPTVEVPQVVTGIEVPDLVVQELPNPPWPYKRREGGGVVIEMEAKDDEPPQTVTLIDYDFYPIKRIEDEDTQQHIVHWRAHTLTDGVKTFRIEPSSVATSNDCGKVLGDLGVGVRPKHRNLMVDYMVAYVQQLSKTIAAEKVLSRLGWRDDDRRFVLPGRCYGPNGVELVNVNPDVQAGLRGLESRGDFETWKQAQSFYNHRGYEPHAFTFLTAFGAPLFKFSGHKGAIISLVGPSGAGKSTVLHAANSVWGHPDELMLNGDKAGSTPTARIIKISLHNNLPVSVDEITKLSADDVGTLCYMISQGHGKDRATQRGKLANDMERWCTMMACSANLSIYEKLAENKSNASAEAARVFEMMVEARRNGMAEADEFLRVLRNNYGLAGDKFAAYITANRDQVKQLVQSSIQKANDATGNDPVARFWTAAVGANIAGAIIAIRAGILPWTMDDVRRLFTWAVGHIKQIRGEVVNIAVTPAAILAEFMNENVQNTLIVGGTSRVGEENILAPFRGQKLVIRRDHTAGKAYIARTELRKFFTQRGVDYTQVKKELIKSGVLRSADIRITLSRGTEFASGQTDCWWIDLNHPSMASVATSVDNDNTV